LTERLVVGWCDTVLTEPFERYLVGGFHSPTGTRAV
jgi:hypothetical protein